MYRRHRSKRTANAPRTIRPHRKQKRSRKSEGRQSESEKAGRDGPTWRRTQKRECERPALRPAASDDDRTALNARRSNGNIPIPIAAKTGSDRPVGTRSNGRAVAQNGRSSTSAAAPPPNEPPSAGMSDGSGASVIGTGGCCCLGCTRQARMSVYQRPLYSRDSMLTETV